MSDKKRSIDFEYLSKIRSAFALRTARKSSNILEGDFRSIYRGRSMEFDELSEYHEGDDVSDIDWNATSRTGQVLVRRYVAERKHFLLFVGDTGIKMSGHTSGGARKSDLAILTFASAAYLCDRNGADYSLMTAQKGQGSFDLFRAGTDHLEKLTWMYEERIEKENGADVSRLLDEATENIRKRMILFLITDFMGLKVLDDNLLQKVTDKNDLLVVNLDDAYLTDENAFDLRQRRYADAFLTKSSALRQEERRQREEILAAAKKRFRQNRVSFVTIRKEEEVIDSIIDLFRQGGQWT
ncbi:MAG: DUF58 domain-containing protein [Lachnospiraceae bacterium]|nr:DUF58 domain-containing protein [Lachnospiraceae bacterium]